MCYYRADTVSITDIYYTSQLLDFLGVRSWVDVKCCWGTNDPRHWNFADDPFCSADFLLPSLNPSSIAF